MAQILCQKCGELGQIRVEKERTKQKRRSKRSTNIQHKEYDASARTRGKYYRIYHYHYEAGKRILSFCYIGNVERFIDEWKKRPKMFSKDEQFVDDMLENHDFSVHNQDFADLLWTLKWLCG